MKPEFEEASVQVQEILALYFWAAGDRRRVGIAGLFGANKRIKTGLRSRDEPPDSAAMSFLQLVM